MRKRIENFLLNATLVVLLLITGVILLSKIYEKEIKNYAVEYMNEYLNAKVSVSDVELSLISHFPSASLTLDNVFIGDINDPTHSDTLLYADALIMTFDFWEVFSGNYEVKYVQANNSVIKLNVSQNGNENYVFWKKGAAKEKSEFKFNLKELRLYGADISYDNFLNDQHYSVRTKQTKLLGNFAETVFDLDINTDAKYNNVSLKGINYIKNEIGSINTVLHIDKEKKEYKIENGKLNISGMKFEINGMYSNFAEGYCNFNILGNQLAINQVMTVFPSRFFERFSSYKSQGTLAFNAIIEGDVSNEEVPKVSANFNVSNASMTEPDLALSLTNINFSGLFNSEKQLLELNNLNCVLLNSKISGGLKIDHFSSPNIDVNLNGNLDLDYVHKFLKITELNYLTGTLNFNAIVKGKTKNGIFKTVSSNGSFTAKNIHFKVADNPLEYSKINSTFKLNNGNAAISSFTGNIFRSQFNFKGVAKNLIPYIIANQGMLVIEADLESDYVDLKEIAKASSSVNQSRGGAPKSIFPKDLALNLNTDIKKLSYGKFDVQNLKGITTIQNQILIAKNFKCNANEGTYKGKFEFDGSNPNNYLLTSSVALTGVDIKNLLQEFDNFGQTFVTDENLSGKTNADINLAIGLDNGFNIIKNSLYAKTKFKISNGELINLPTLIDIANYVSNHKLIKPFVDTKVLNEKIKHITFNDLENEITIKNEVIYVPRMEIKSSLIDVNIKGEHGFDDSINYGINFRLREALMKQDRDEEFGYVVDDGSGAKIFVSIMGTVNNPIFGLDKEERKLARKEKIELEKQTMKSVLKQELGLFKKDTTVHSLQIKKNIETKFDVDWEEFDKDSTYIEEPESLKKRKEKKDGKLNKLFKNLESTLEGKKENNTSNFKFEGEGDL